MNHQINIDEAIAIAKEFHTYSDIFIYRCSKCGKIKLKYGIKIEIKC